MIRACFSFVAGAIVAFVAVACSAGHTAQADTDGPQDVRVQQYGSCLIFTHDTMQGASIAVSCGRSSLKEG